MLLQRPPAWLTCPVHLATPVRYLTPSIVRTLATVHIETKVIQMAAFVLAAVRVLRESVDGN
ncbi:hypothetical protein WU83_19410 [Mycobacterium nebraskense]|nr:hypothetical protein WU83_19410 [Mycobacterium nebraskense]